MVFAWDKGKLEKVIVRANENSVDVINNCRERCGLISFEPQSSYSLIGDVWT
jgi:hypothetical protein